MSIFGPIFGGFSNRLSLNWLDMAPTMPMSGLLYSNHISPFGYNLHSSAGLFGGTFDFGMGVYPGPVYGFGGDGFMRLRMPNSLWGWSPLSEIITPKSYAAVRGALSGGDAFDEFNRAMALSEYRMQQRRAERGRMFPELSEKDEADEGAEQAEAPAKAEPSSGDNPFADLLPDGMPPVSSEDEPPVPAPSRKASAIQGALGANNGGIVESAGTVKYDPATDTLSFEPAVRLSRTDSMGIGSIMRTFASRYVIANVAVPEVPEAEEDEEDSGGDPLFPGGDISTIMPGGIPQTLGAPGSFQLGSPQGFGAGAGRLRIDPSLTGLTQEGDSPAELPAERPEPEGEPAEAGPTGVDWENLTTAPESREAYEQGFDPLLAYYNGKLGPAGGSVTLSPEGEVSYEGEVTGSNVGTLTLMLIDLQSCGGERVKNIKMPSVAESE